MQSSANIRAFEFRFSGRSLIKIKNRTGPNTEPWGTPLITGTFSDDWPSTKTCCVLWLRNEAGVHLEEQLRNTFFCHLYGVHVRKGCAWRTGFLVLIFMSMYWYILSVENFGFSPLCCWIVFLYLLSFNIVPKAFLFCRFLIFWVPHFNDGIYVVVVSLPLQFLCFWLAVPVFSYYLFHSCFSSFSCKVWLSFWLWLLLSCRPFCSIFEGMCLSIKQVIRLFNRFQRLSEIQEWPPHY